MLVIWSPLPTLQKRSEVPDSICRARTQQRPDVSFSCFWLHLIALPSPNLLFHLLWSQRPVVKCGLKTEHSAGRCAERTRDRVPGTFAPGFGCTCSVLTVFLASSTRYTVAGGRMQRKSLYLASLLSGVSVLTEGLGKHVPWMEGTTVHLIFLSIKNFSSRNFFFIFH